MTETSLIISIYETIIRPYLVFGKGGVYIVGTGIFTDSQKVLYSTSPTRGALATTIKGTVSATSNQQAAI